MTPVDKQLAYRISIRGMLINFLLFIAKGIAGILIDSVSLLSDSIHSLTDIFSTLVVLIGLKVSNKPADSEHPYGHEKIECVIALLLGLMLFGIGGVISWEGITKLRNLSSVIEQTTILNAFAIGAAMVSIAAKEWMYHFTIKCARQIHSPSMAADAWHHRSDAISSVGSLIGVVGICLGYPIIDVLACFIISIFIFKAAYDICADACKRIIDCSGEESVVECIKNAILSNPDVLSLDLIKTRQFGSKLYVDVEVTLDYRMSFEQAHKVAHLIHDSVENAVSEVKHCMVHVNPSI